MIDRTLAAGRRSQLQLDIMAVQVAPCLGSLVRTHRNAGPTEEVPSARFWRREIVIESIERTISSEKRRVSEQYHQYLPLIAAHIPDQDLTMVRSLCSAVGVVRRVLLWFEALLMDNIG